MLLLPLTSLVLPLPLNVSLSPLVSLSPFDPSIFRWRVFNYACCCSAFSVTAGRCVYVANPLSTIPAFSLLTWRALHMKRTQLRSSGPQENQQRRRVSVEKGKIHARRRHASQYMKKETPSRNVWYIFDVTLKVRQKCYKSPRMCFKSSNSHNCHGFLISGDK